MPRSARRNKIRTTHPVRDAEDFKKFPIPPSLAGLLGDLHVYDPRAMTWTDLTAAASGAPPAARYAFGFATAGGRLYVHAGCTSTDEYGNCNGERDGGGGVTREQAYVDKRDDSNMGPRPGDVLYLLRSLRGVVSPPERRGGV